MKIINLKDAINRRLYKRLIIVETPIHRVSCLNRTVLLPLNSILRWNDEVEKAIATLGIRHLVKKNVET
ncbi:MAG: hypothetical protein V7L27_19325 [Nostoc sp.]|uniref:hypothetical protein n=1 Tax=Nostoc sp. TaxID=1180 RepID=UPI002FF68541